MNDTITYLIDLCDEHGLVDFHAIILSICDSVFTGECQTSVAILELAFIDMQIQDTIIDLQASPDAEELALLHPTFLIE